MFCSKCGTQVPEGAAFCPKCGMKLAQAVTPDAGIPKPTDSVKAKVPEKKKSKKKPLIIGAGLLALVVMIVVIAASLGGGTDYEATVRAYTPFKESQGISYTCGEVFDRYIQDMKWNIQENDRSADVTVSGGAKGTGKELQISMHLEEREETVQFSSIRLVYDGNELSGNGFFALFVAYDENDGDISSYEALVSELDISLSGNELKGTFFDETSGISFKYPDFWIQRDGENEFELVNLYSPRNTANHRATIEFGITGDYYGIFTGDEASVENEVNSTGTLTFMDFMDISTEDVPVKALRYKTAGLNGEDDIVVTIWSMVEQEVYRLALSYTEATTPVYGPIFEAVADSFSVDPLEPSVTPEQAYDIVMNWATRLAYQFMETLDGSQVPASVSQDYYVFEMVTAGTPVGYLYVDKTEGNLYYSSNLGVGIQDADEWYESIMSSEPIEGLCWNNISADDIVLQPLDSFIEKMGEPYYVMDDGEYTYIARYDNIDICFNSDYVVYGFITDPGNCTWDGVPLDGTSDEIAGALGYAGEFDYGDKFVYLPEDNADMVFAANYFDLIPGYYIRFEYPDENAKADRIYVYYF